MNAKPFRIYAATSASAASTEQLGGDQARSAAAFVRVALEDAIVEALDVVPSSRETTRVAFQRKEHAIAMLFAKLTVSDARILHRRLTIPSDGDAIASRFALLIAERRARLIAFLADARRREVVAMARSH